MLPDGSGHDTDRLVSEVFRRTDILMPTVMVELMDMLARSGRQQIKVWRQARVQCQGSRPCG